MKIQLLVPIAMPMGDRKTVDLKPGTHDIDDNILAHWFMRGLIKEGKIRIVENKPLLEKKVEVGKISTGRGLIPPSSPKPKLPETPPSSAPLRPVVGSVHVNYVDKSVAPTPEPDLKPYAPQVEVIVPKAVEEPVVEEAKIEVKEVKPKTKKSTKKKK